MRTILFKRLLLAVLMMALLLSATGCFITPDPIDDSSDISVVTIVPLPTESVTPSPSPEAEDDDFFAWATKAPPNTAIQLTTAPTQNSTPEPSANASAQIAVMTTDMLKEGAEGQQVQLLQQRLTDLGYYTGTLDAAFGPATNAALKDFQKGNGLSSDGIAGPKTIEVLFSENAIPKKK